MRRRICSLVAAIGLLAGLAVTAATPTPAGAAPVDVDLEMVDGGGILQLRGAAAYNLTNPTEITGSIDDQTGNLSGLEFSTPQVHIERKITQPLKADVTIDATFSQVAPGTGVLDADDILTIEQQLTVDLHIEVTPDGTDTPLVLPGDCQASPVNLTLTSANPYNRDTQRVTVSTDDFTIPEIPIDANCDATIGDQVNKELKGAGHSLSLLLHGPLPEIIEGDCTTTTELTVDPAGQTALGAGVTLTANTVTDANDPECVAHEANSEFLSGTVDFFRGATLIGSGVLDGTGEATFSTTGLPAGTHQLTAKFRGNSPFIKSTSPAVEHRITTQPTVTTDLPTFIKIGAQAEFTYTVANSQFGDDLDDVRAVMTFNTFGVRPLIDRWDGAAWQPVPTLGNEPHYWIALPEFDLAAGAERTEKLRISSDPGSNPGQADVIFELKPGSDPVFHAPTANPLGTASLTTVFHAAERVPSAIESLYPDPISPHTVRQGETVTIDAMAITPAFTGNQARGYWEFFLDGGQVAVGLWPNSPRPGEEILRAPTFANGPGGTVLIHLPAAISTGTHNVTVRFSGDSTYLPSQVTWPFTVVPARGPSYQCFSEGAPPVNFRVNVSAQANVPFTAEPGELALDDLDIAMFTDKSITTAYNLYGMFNDDGPTAIGEMGLLDIGFNFSGGGTGTATHLVQSNPYELPSLPNPAPDPDRVLSFTGETGSTTIAGDVGEVVPVTLDAIEVNLLASGFIPYNLICTPVDSPLQLGEVRITGVGLTVSPSGSVRANSEVELTANTGNPAVGGVVEFVDGTDTIGVVSVAGGTAAMTTDDLEPGNHTLKVRYYPEPTGPVQVSPDVALEVLPEFDCGDFVIEADEPNGAVVRLVYMELLNRCPDQAGYDYWLEQLDNGVPRTKFAETISRSNEALDQIVIDAYQTTLERNPSAPDLAFWREFLRDRGRYDVLLAALSGSPEFYTLAGSTRAGLVTRVYNRLLGRDPEPSGLEYWTDQLLAGKLRSTVMRTIAKQTEPMGVIVDQSFDEILDTAPTPTERAAAILELQRTGNRSALYAKLIGDPRFAERALEYPNF